MSSSSSKKSTSHMLAGFVAGMTSTVVLFPLDLIKVRFQVHDGQGSAYKGLFDATRSILRVEGWRGFYGGLTPAVAASAASWGGYFYFYDSAKQRKMKNLPKL